MGRSFSFSGTTTSRGLRGIYDDMQSGVWVSFLLLPSLGAFLS